MEERLFFKAGALSRNRLPTQRAAAWSGPRSPEAPPTMKRFLLTSLFSAASFVLISSATHAEVKLPPVITDHMVLQREIAAPIWGAASPGEEISVSIAGQVKKAKAAATGARKVKLDPLKAAEGLTLIVKGTNALTIQEVLVGEVWFGSGQSNMAGAIRTFKVNDEGLQKTLAAAPYPRIRLIKPGGQRDS